MSEAVDLVVPVFLRLDLKDKLNFLMLCTKTFKTVTGNNETLAWRQLHNAGGAWYKLAKAHASIDSYHVVRPRHAMAHLRFRQSLAVSMPPFHLWGYPAAFQTRVARLAFTLLDLDGGSCSTTAHLGQHDSTDGAFKYDLPFQGLTSADEDMATRIETGYFENHVAELEQGGGFTQQELDDELAYLHRECHMYYPGCFSAAGRAARLEDGVREPNDNEDLPWAD